MKSDSFPAQPSHGDGVASASGPTLRSLRSKILLPLLVAGAAIAGLAIWAFSAKSHEALVETLGDKAQLVANMVINATAPPVELAALQRIVAAVGKDEAGMRVVVVGDEPMRVLGSTEAGWIGKEISEIALGQELARLGSSGLSGVAKHQVLDQRGKVFDFRMPLTRDESQPSHRKGAIFIRYDIGPALDDIRKSVLEFTIAFVVILGTLTGLGYWLLNCYVLVPIKALGKYIQQRHSDGDRYWLQAAGNDELGGLASTLKDSLLRTDGALHDLENYKAALDQHGIVLMTDLHGRITHVNNNLCAISKYSREELIGQSPKLLYSGHHPKEFFSNMWATISAGEVWQGEVCDRAKDGDLYWTASTMVPLVGSDGVARQFIGIGKEITQRKRMEADLAYERDLLRTLLENIPDQIYFKDLNSKFIRCSKSVGRRFNQESEQDMLGKSDFDFYADDHARPAFEDEQRIIRTGESVLGKIEKENWKECKDVVTWALTTKVALRDANGTIIGTFGISKDITDIKVAEARVEEINRQLLETSRQAGMAEVATSVLHNVGNVLNSVNVSCSVISSNVRKSRIESVTRIAELLRDHQGDLAEFLTNDPGGSKLPEYIGHLAERLVAEQSSLLDELKLLGSNIDHIKEIVAMQQNYGRVCGVTETLEVSELVEESLRINASSFTRHELQVFREYSEVPLLTIEKHKVLQILINLVRNAKNACTESGRPDKQITMQIAAAGESVRISIIDNGVGIPPENLTKIFSHGFTTRAHGHGFGLHSSVLSAREMGGSLTVHSDGPGRGAIFTLELPLNGSENLAQKINSP